MSNDWNPVKIRPQAKGFVLTDAGGRKKLTAAIYPTERSARAARAEYLKREKQRDNQRDS